MENISIKEILDYKKFAVIGASNDPSKYGNKVFRYLINSGFNVFPINPSSDKILEHKAYKNIDELVSVEEIDVVVFVVPPNVSFNILKNSKTFQNKKIKAIWFQPGSENEEVIEFCKSLDIPFVYQICVMVENDKFRL